MLHLYLAAFVLVFLLLALLSHLVLQDPRGRQLMMGAVLQLVTPVFVFMAEAITFVGTGWVIVPLLLMAWYTLPPRLRELTANVGMVIMGMVVSMYTMYANFVTQRWSIHSLLFLEGCLVCLNLFFCFRVFREGRNEHGTRPAVTALYCILYYILYTIFVGVPTYLVLLRIVDIIAGSAYSILVEHSMLPSDSNMPPLSEVIGSTVLMIVNLALFMQHWRRINPTTRAVFQAWF